MIALARQMSLTTRGVVAAVVLLVWVVVGSLALQERAGALREARNDTANLTRAFEENVTRTVEEIDQTITFIRKTYAAAPETFDITRYAGSSILTGGLTLQIALIGPDGILRSTSLDAPGAGTMDLSDREHFRVHLRDQRDFLFISRPVLGRASGKWSLQFTRKLIGANGRFDGVILVSLDPSYLARFYQSISLGNHSGVRIFGLDGTMRVAAPDQGPLGAPIPPDLLAAASAAASGTIELRDGARTQIASFRRLAHNDLVVAVLRDRDEVLVPFWGHMRIYLAVAAVLSVLALMMVELLTRGRRRLIESRRTLEAAVANISQGLMVIDGSRRVPIINQRAAELLEFPRELLERPGLTFDDLTSWQLAQGEFGSTPSSFRDFVVNGGIDEERRVYRRTRRNGTVLEVHTRQIAGGWAVRTFTDITAQQRHEEELAAAREAAEAASRARSEFLATMSHEIRTPLNGLIGMTDLLTDDALTPRQLQAVRVMRDCGDHLLSLVNDVLDFSRLDAGRLELEEVDWSASEWFERTIAMMQAPADARGLRLTGEMSAAVPPVLRGDPGRLRQVLINIISNAIKFTHSGEVAVTVDASQAASGIKLTLAVSDTGIGIEADALAHLFNEFTQANGSISRRFGGSGLGLAICRRLCQLMDGTITVESTPGQGSTFRITVNMAIGDPDHLAPSGSHIVASRTPPLRVLVAEDNATNRLVVTRMLERLGHQVTTVEDGHAAVAAVQAGEYDLVLMDLMMPELDGNAATRQIRNLPGDAGAVRIIGLSASVLVEDRAACLAAGMDGFATKPITEEKLAAAIAASCPQGERMAAGPTPASMPEQRPAAAVTGDMSGRLDELEDVLGGAVAAEIVETFLDGAGALLASLRAAVAASDHNAIRRSAHALVGAACNVGLETVAARARHIEHAAATGAPDQLDASIRLLTEDLGQRSAELKRWLADRDLAAADQHLPAAASDPDHAASMAA